MNLSISNIAWSSSNDLYVYELMKNYGFLGLEIAPTRIFPNSPYDDLYKAKEWSDELKNQYGFSISSMQSIWYGRTEKIFGSEEERLYLIVYTKKAIDFASIIGCKNLVFGCPKNRNISNENDKIIGINFFKEIGDYAFSKGTVIGMEANPVIYNTNYINDTNSVIDLIRQVNSQGFKLNLDVGTIIYNDEDLENLVGNVKLINHVHISEPMLKPIEHRTLHNELKNILVNENYKGYISIEMGKIDENKYIENSMEYIRFIYGK